MHKKVKIGKTDKKGLFFMEYLDILDEKGNKTGEVKPRQEVHSKGYWHKGVHIWIINSKKELLVQRRSANKDVYPNKLYISVAGHVECCSVLYLKN